MRRAERVVHALRALGETVQASGLADGADAVAPPGQDLVGIRLVTHVPDQPVLGRIEQVVQHRRQLHHTEAGAKVPSRYRHRVDRLGAQFVRELL